MNDYQVPPNRFLKHAARQLMRYPGCPRAALVVTGLYLLAMGLRTRLGASLTYALADLSKYQDTATGFYPNEQGFSLILRMDITQTVLAIPLTYRQIFLFLVVTFLAFLVLSPLRLGMTALFWQLLFGKRPTLRETFLPWLSLPERWGKAVVVEVLMQGVVRLLGLVALLPSVLLYYYFYTHVTSLNQMTTQLALLPYLALLLVLGAGLFTFYLHSVFLPIRYCLAAHPEFTLHQVFTAGLHSMRGYRGRFFRFRLTFLLWFLLSELTYHILDILVLPYTSLASMLYIQALALEQESKEKQHNSSEIGVRQ